MKWLLITLLLFAVPCWGQEAKVLQLDPADTARAKKLYEQRQQAGRDWEDFQQAIKEKYLTVPYESPERGNTWYEPRSPIAFLDYVTTTNGCSIIEQNMTIEKMKWCEEEEARSTAAQKIKEKALPWKRAGWENFEFEFSKEFKFIVPKPISLPWKDGCVPMWKPANSN